MGGAHPRSRLPGETPVCVRNRAMALCPQSPFPVKITTQTIRALKGKRPVVALTAYDAITARLVSEAGVDVILVGDSVGTTLLGYDTTVPVTLDMLVHHTAAAARAKPDSLLVADVPFGVAHAGFDAVLGACMRLMQEGGAEAVKIEGGAAMAPTVEKLVAAGIPVLGHVGLLPQQFFQLGGYRKFGKKVTEQQALIEDAKAIEQAGAFAVVCEMVDAETAKAMAEAIAVPLIGIGSGKDCDGQILVCTDLLGLNPGKLPSFVKTYADLKTTMRQAFSAYAEEVRQRTFP